MHKITNTFLSVFFTRRAGVLFFFVFLACSFFPSFKLFPFHWMLFGLVEFFGFFYFLAYCSKNWRSFSEKRFLKDIFKTALIIRVFYVIFIYWFYSWMTGVPFEFEAGDAHFYDSFSGDIANRGLQHAFELAKVYKVGFSDMGFPLYLGFIYTIFGKVIIIPRLINAVFSAWMCILIYRISKRHFGEETARLAAIISMLLPNFIYYCGLHLKETLMLFLLVLFIERISWVLQGAKFKIKDLLPSILIGACLFMFRMVLGVSAWMAVFTVLAFTNERFVGWGKRFVIGIWLLVAVLFFFSGQIEDEATASWNHRAETQAQNMKFRAERKDGNKLAKYGSAAVFAPVIFVVPLTTLVNMPDQQNTMLMNGSLFVKNVMAFFIFVSFYILFFRDRTFRKHLLLFAFYFIYLVILVFSPFALSERFHLPTMPFFVIFAAYGITQTDKKIARYYVPYLVLIGLMIFGWNMFKLVGKGYIN